MTIPSLVVGVRTATLALTSDACPLALGFTAYDTVQLRYISSLFIPIDTKTEFLREKTYVDPATLDWWEGNTHDGKGAGADLRGLCWAGSSSIVNALYEVKQFFEKFQLQPNADGSSPLTVVCKPPAFDIPILNNVFGHYKVHVPAMRKPTIVDSGNTIERSMEVLGFQMSSSLEDHHWLRGENFIPHYPKHESARIAYMAARYYHLLHLIANRGYDAAVTAHTSMLTGEYHV